VIVERISRHSNVIVFSLWGRDTLAEYQDVEIGSSSPCGGGMHPPYFVVSPPYTSSHELL
jgi:hypothetical protein